MLKFTRVKKNDTYVNVLYELLKKRIYNISNTQIPSFDDHKFFVLNHPYRAWYLIKSHDDFIGSMYILRDNCISINLLSHDELIITTSLNWLLSKWSPLPAIKSIRSSSFYINVSPMNLKLQSFLASKDLYPLQITYALKNYLK